MNGYHGSLSLARPSCVALELALAVVVQTCTCTMNMNMNMNVNMNLNVYVNVRIRSFVLSVALVARRLRGLHGEEVPGGPRGRHAQCTRRCTSGSRRCSATPRATPMRLLSHAPLPLLLLRAARR